VRRAPRRTRLALLEREGRRAEEVLAQRPVLVLPPVGPPEREPEQVALQAPVQERPVQERPVPPESAPSAGRQRP
jgi:hypothetical protein